MRKKRSVTLIEIMIVIMLIGLIGGALAFNMRGSMDQGRAFKTEQNQMRVRDILLLEHATGDQELQEVVNKWQTIVNNSPIGGGKKNALTQDGWKKTFVVTLDGEDVKVHSDKLEEFNKRHAKS